AVGAPAQGSGARRSANQQSANHESRRSLGPNQRRPPLSGTADALVSGAGGTPMAEYDTWRPWPIWSAVWVGSLAAIAVGLIIGLIGFAVGAHELAAPRFTTWKNVRLITSIFNICGAFFAFVVGGWIAARIAGLRRAEPAMLHGGVVWLLAIPMLL